MAAEAQTTKALKQPINALEQDCDAHAVWRNYVNAQLAKPYQALYEKIEYLIVLQPPFPDIVLTWRIAQEDKLRSAAKSERTDANPEANPQVGMSNEQLVNFVMHYERLVRHMHGDLPTKADVMVILDEKRMVTDMVIQT